MAQGNDGISGKTRGNERANGRAGIREEKFENLLAMVTRRRFVLVLGAGALAPASSFAQQQTKVWRVGVLSLDTSESDAGQSALKELPAALKKLGYGEGRNLAIEWRWGDGRTGDLRELAVGLVRAGVDVIVARTNDPIRAAMDATRSVTIVMLNGT